MSLNKLILSLINLKGIGPSYILKNKSQIIDNLGNNDFFKIILGKKYLDFTNQDFEIAQDKASKILDISNENDIKILNFSNKNYPKQLKHINNYPLLFIKGNFKSDKKICGIIGSREATIIGKKITAKVSKSFQEKDFYILNGLAEGIDQATYATQEMLHNIIGVSPGGLALKHRTLTKKYTYQAEYILERDGILISQFTPLTKQDTYKVSEYCKLQASLSNILILIQSKIDGGSRFTIAEFIKLKRNLGILNGNLFDQNQIEAYEANIEIFNNKNAGLELFTKVKSNKIKSNIIEINSRDDYQKLIEINIQNEIF